MKAQILVLSFLLISANACGSTISSLKASPAPDSGYLQGAERMTEQRERYPFHRVWSAEPNKEAKEYTDVFIAPVNTQHLAKMSWWSEVNYPPEDYQSETKALADFTRKTFEEVVINDPAKRFRLVTADSITPKTLILQLALVEIVPTKVIQNIAGTAAGSIIPGGSIIASGSTGSVAIEGREIAADQDKTVFMFADREKGKYALFSIHDFSWFGHAKEVIEDWAKQWHAVHSLPPGKHIADSSALTIMPW